MKKILIYSFLLLCLGGLSQFTYGQQDPQYSQYMFNGIAYNPAYAGSRDALSGVMLLRRQWIGIDGGPSTGSFALHGPSKNLRHGFGLQYVHDRLGLTVQQFLTASYAYRIPMGELGHLALGIQGGFTHFKNRFEEANAVSSDGQLPQSNLGAALPRAGAGLYLDFPRFYLGLSAPNILDGRYFTGGNQVAADLAARQKSHYFVTTGVVIPLGESLDLRPSIVGKYVQDAPFEMDFDLALLIKKTFWVGLGYRTGDAAKFMIEYFSPKGLRIGYAYDLTLTQLKTVNAGSHELMIGFDLGTSRDKIITPRYF